MEENTQLATYSEDAEQLIQSYADRLQDRQLEVLPLLSFGMSVPRIEKVTGIRASTIHTWKTTDPVFQEAMTALRELKNSYHELMLNQAGALAWNTILNILSNDLEDVKYRADIAKFIVGQLTTKTQKIEVSDNSPQLHMTEDSANIIAKKIKALEHGDIVDTEYQITSPTEEIDEEVGMDTAQAVAEFNDLDFDAEFTELEKDSAQKYVMFPGCKMGEINFNEKSQKWQCHMCGTWSRDLVVHIRRQHNISAGRYRNMYQIPDDVKFYIDVPSPATDSEIEEYNTSIEGD